MAKPEIYVSTDIEANGPIPGTYSMLALGSVALDRTGKEISRFYATIKPIDTNGGHPETMAWWKTQPKAWEAVNKDTRFAEDVMKDYCNWLKGLPGKPVLVAYPVAFDSMFVLWYLFNFTGENPFGFNTIDIKTLAWTRLGGNLSQATKRRFPKRWFSKLPHNHVAVDDAAEQGQLFINIMADDDDELWGPQ